MSLNVELKRWYIRPMPGMSNRHEAREQGDKHVVNAQNTRFDSPLGAVYKRPSYKHYNPTSLGANPITAGYRFYKSDGTIKTYVVYDTNIKVGDDAAGTFSNLSLPADFTLTADNRMRFLTYKDLVIMSNGTDNILMTDGSSDNVAWEMGACKAATGSSTGITKTNVSYAVTIDDDAYVCGAVSNEISSLSDEDVELTEIPLGPSGTSNRKIYRKDSSTSSTYKLVDTISDNSTTTYTDTTADVSGAAAMPAVTDDMPTGSILTLHRERLFVSGNSTYPNRIWYSNPYLPHYIQGTTNLDYMQIAADDGDEIMGLPIQLGVMICVKKNTVRRLHITSPTSGASPTQWYAEDPIAWVGAVAEWSVVQTRMGVVFLGRDNIYVFDGSRVQPIITQFNPRDSILLSRYHNSVMHSGSRHLYLAYTDKNVGNSYHDRVLLYNFNSQKASIDTLSGSGINCFFSYNGDDEHGDVYMGDSVNGYVYRTEDTPQWIRITKKSEVEEATLDDIYVGGEENDPWFEVGRGEIDELTGTIDNLTGTIDMPDTGGTITFPVQYISADTLLYLYWHHRLYHEDDTVTFSVRTGDVETPDATWTAWSAFTDQQSDISSVTGDTYLQVKCELSANSTAGSPRVYFSKGFLIKYSYRVGGAEAETAVEFVYEIGERNFSEPFLDKVFKRIISVHEATSSDGTFQITWETENSSGSFTVDTANTPERWSSFFPSDAMGKEINLKIYKNDLLDIKIKEIQGAYTPQPLII